MKPHSPASLLGKFSLAVTLLASATEPLPENIRRGMKIKMHDGVVDISRAVDPSLESWRNLADAMNFLQSCSEFGWIQDKDDAIGAAKAALLEGHANVQVRGKLRVGGPAMGQLTNLAEQFCELIDTMPARMYWSAVRRTEKRIGDIWKGRQRAGDVVLTL